MEINVRKYRASDRSSIVHLMEKFGDYLVSVDSMKRIRRMPGYGEYFTRKMLDDVKKNKGLIYVAEHEHELSVSLQASCRGNQKKSCLIQYRPKLEE